MSRRWFLLFLLFFLPACIPPSPVKGGGNPLLQESVPITRKVLDNGLTVLVKEVHRTPAVSIMAYVKTGSAHEGPWTGSGISHAVEHLFFKGTETRGVGEIDKEIRSYGGDINAFTSHDVTGYALTSNRGHTPEALALLADALFQMRLEAQEFEREKEVILGEIRLNRDDPFHRAHTLLWQEAYRNHPYRHPVIGYEPLLKALTSEDLGRYYREKYIPNNMILVLVGDVRAEEVLEEVRRYFGPLERKLLPPEARWVEPRQVGSRELREELPIQTAHLVMGYHTVRVTDGEMYPLDVLAILLGQGESSRLVRRLLKERELVYGVEASHYTPLDPGLFTVEALLEPEKIPETLSVIREELAKIHEGTMDERELEKAKRQVLSAFYFSQETLQSQARQLAENEAAGLDPLFLERYVRGISSVRAEDIQQAARRYLKDENLTLITLVPEISGEGSEPERPTPEISEIYKRLLPNGVRVLLQEDPVQPTVSLGVVLLGGLRFENEKTEGISNFVSRLVTQGTSSRSEKEIAEWVDAHGAVLNPFSGQNSLGIRMKVLKEDWVEGLGLLKELLVESTFPAEEMEKERKRILGEIKTERDAIFKVGERLLRKTLYHHHPYRLYPLGREETISRLSREECLAFYKRLLSPERMVVTLFGDIRREEAEKEVERLFSRLPSPGSPTVQPPPEHPLEEPRTVTETLPKEQALLLIGFHGISIKDEATYAFEVLTGILSGGGGGKLYAEIRDKKGQAYTLGAYPVWGLDPGYFVFYVATTPEEMASVEGQLLSEIESLRHEPIASEDIRRVQESLIGLHPLALQTNDALSFQSGLDELYELGYDWYLAYEERIRAVTASDLQRIASTYFHPEKKAVVRLLPERKKSE